MKNLLTVLLIMFAARALSPASPGVTKKRTHTTHEPSSPPLRPLKGKVVLKDTMLNDPHSPVVGALFPKLKIVSFISYDCIHCRQLDNNFERLLKAYPQIAITYKLLANRSEGSTSATRMALTVWIDQRENFHKFHHELMSRNSMQGDQRIHSALRASGVKLNRFRPGMNQIIEANEILLQSVHYSNTPVTIIGDHIISGSVPYDDLKKAVNEALENSKTNASS